MASLVNAVRLEDPLEVGSPFGVSLYASLDRCSVYMACTWTAMWLRSSFFLLIASGEPRSANWVASSHGWRRCGSATMCKGEKTVSISVRARLHSCLAAASKTSIMNGPLMKFPFPRGR